MRMGVGLRRRSLDIWIDRASIGYFVWNGDGYVLGEESTHDIGITFCGKI